MSRILAICIALLGGAAACVPATLPSYAPITRTPAPLPSQANALILETAPPAASGPGPGRACAESTPVSVRVVREGDALVVETVTGERMALVWPRGFSARLLDGRAEIVAPDGSVVAREGDELASGTLSGPSSGICGVNGVYYPPAS